MIYATSDDYTQEELELASAKLDELAFGRINGIGFDNLTVFQREKIQQATLMQAKYYKEYGIDAGNIQSFSVLDTSITLTDGSASVPPGVSANAYMLLKQTGLLYRGI